MVRIQVALLEEEAAALARLAASEMRAPREPARYMVRAELARRGLLPDTPESVQTADPLRADQMHGGR